MKTEHDGTFKDDNQGPSATKSQQMLPTITETHRLTKQSDDAAQRNKKQSVVSQHPSIGHQTQQPTFPGRGPSLIGLLASKKLAKQLTSRIQRRRNGSLFGSSGVLQKEPTYRMEPQVKFDSLKVEQCIKSVLEDRLQRFPYNPKFCANMSKILSDDIKTEVKAMNFDRYKIVCSILIGQRKDQGIHVTSRCAWDEKLDNYASYTFKNEKIFCVAIVHGIYHE